MQTLKHCPKCGSQGKLESNTMGWAFFVQCTNYPKCTFLLEEHRYSAVENKSRVIELWNNYIEKEDLVEELEIASVACRKFKTFSDLFHRASLTIRNQIKELESLQKDLEVTTKSAKNLEKDFRDLLGLEHAN